MARTHATRPRACDQARSLVSLRLDDELSELEQALLDAHLGRCSPCSAFAAEVTEATTVLRSAPLAGLEHALALPLTRRRGYLRGLQTAAAGAVAAAAVVASVIGVTPAVENGSSGYEVAEGFRFAEPVSPRRELQLRPEVADRDGGPAGVDIPV